MAGDDRILQNSSDFGADSSSLLLRLRASDQAAWDRFVALYGPLVYLWCRNAGLQPADAADVGQEVFRAVARKINDFRRDRAGGSFRGWVHVITRNKILDFLRVQSKQATAAGGTDALADLLAVPAESDSGTDGTVIIPENVSAADDRAERHILFRRAVDLIRSSFEESTCLAFWRVAVEGHSPKDVAADLNLSPNAVYLAKSKVLRRLRDEFGDVVDL